MEGEESTPRRPQSSDCPSKATPGQSGDNYNQGFFVHSSELERQREENKRRLKSRFEEIFEKYEHDFTGIGDEIDLKTGEVVVDNGHIAHMKHEADPGTGGSSEYRSSVVEDASSTRDDEAMAFASDDSTEVSDEEDEDVEDVFGCQVNLGERSAQAEHGTSAALSTAELDTAIHKTEDCVSVNVLDYRPALETSLLAMQSRSHNDSLVDQDAREISAQAIASQLTAFACSSAPLFLANNKRKDRSWEFPQLPADERPCEEHPMQLYRGKSRSHFKPTGDDKLKNTGSIWATSQPRRFLKKPRIISNAADESDGTSELQHTGDQKKCSNCQIACSTYWRKGPFGILCNPCWMFHYRHGRMKPPRLPSPSPCESRFDDGHYSANTSRRVISRQFAHVEDALIIKLKEIDAMTWENIGLHFPSRSAYAVQNRYSKKLAGRKSSGRDTLIEQGFRMDPTGSMILREGGFSHGEDEELMQLRLEDNLSWGQIAEHFAGHTATTVESRFGVLTGSDLVDQPSTTGTPARDVLGTKAQRPRFTDEEDNELLQLREEATLCWADIAPYFPGRSAGSLQKRYTRDLTRKKLRFKGRRIAKPSVYTEMNSAPGVEDDEKIMQLRDDQNLSWEAIQELCPENENHSVISRSWDLQDRAEEAAAGSQKQPQVENANSLNQQPDVVRHKVSDDQLNTIETDSARAESISSSSRSSRQRKVLARKLYNNAEDDLMVQLKRRCFTWNQIQLYMPSRTVSSLLSRYGELRKKSEGGYADREGSVCAATESLSSLKSAPNPAAATAVSLDEQQQKSVQQHGQSPAPSNIVDSVVEKPCPSTKSDPSRTEDSPSAVIQPRSLMSTSAIVATHEVHQTVATTYLVEQLGLDDLRGSVGPLLQSEYAEDVTINVETTDNSPTRPRCHLEEHGPLGTPSTEEGMLLAKLRTTGLPFDHIISPLSSQTDCGTALLYTRNVAHKLDVLTDSAADVAAHGTVGEDRFNAQLLGPAFQMTEKRNVYTQASPEVSDLEPTFWSTPVANSSPTHLQTYLTPLQHGAYGLPYFVAPPVPVHSPAVPTSHLDGPVTDGLKGAYRAAGPLKSTKHDVVAKKPYVEGYAAQHEVRMQASPREWTKWKPVIVRQTAESHSSPVLNLAEDQSPPQRRSPAVLKVDRCTQARRREVAARRSIYLRGITESESDQDNDADEIHEPASPKRKVVPAGQARRCMRPPSPSIAPDDPDYMAPSMSEHSDTDADADNFADATPLFARRRSDLSDSNTASDCVGHRVLSSLPSREPLVHAAQGLSAPEKLDYTTAELAVIGLLVAPSRQLTSFDVVTTLENEFTHFQVGGKPVRKRLRDNIRKEMHRSTYFTRVKGPRGVVLFGLSDEAYRSISNKELRIAPYGKGLVLAETAIPSTNAQGVGSPIGGPMGTHKDLLVVHEALGDIKSKPKRAIIQSSVSKSAAVHQAGSMPAPLLRSENDIFSSELSGKQTQGKHSRAPTRSRLPNVPVDSKTSAELSHLDANGIDDTNPSLQSSSRKTRTSRDEVYSKATPQARGVERLKQQTSASFARSSPAVRSMLGSPGTFGSSGRCSSVALLGSSKRVVHTPAPARDADDSEDELAL